jgi:hypothetical protein
MRWFFLPLEAPVIWAQWALIKNDRPMNVISAWAATVPTSTLAMVVIGPKEAGNYGQWSLGYAAGTVWPHRSRYSLFGTRNAG